MGGSVFAEDNLYTPRMSPAIYRQTLDQVESTLRIHFRHVDHPIEAPAKSSHGDIDVLVAEPFVKETVTGEDLANLLTAKKWKKSACLHFALPWPTEDNSPSNSESVIAISSSSSSASPEKFIQADIHVFPTLAQLKWHLFLQAHGDLWNMLGGIIRRMGLTCNGKGLSLRIAEAEHYNKEQSRVKMTDDPDVILQYLGLDIQRYWKAFETWDGMMAYAASCRFHDPGRWKENSANGIKANDRQRAAKRPIFGYWMNTYLPAHQDDKPGRDAFMSRADVVEDAKKYFGPEFAQSFDDRKVKLITVISRDKLFADIRKAVSIEGAEIGYVMKGMKREIAGEDMPVKDELLEIERSELADIRAAYRQNEMEEVLVWAKNNWKVVGQRQKALDQRRGHVNFMDKLKREKEKGNSRDVKKGGKSEAEPAC